MGISSKLENSDSRMIKLPSSGGLNFEASDQVRPVKLLIQFGAAYTF
jgi:hypothetical protein